MTKKKTMKPIITAADQESAEKNHKGLVGECNRLRKEVEHLRDVQAALNDRLFSQKDKITNEVIEADLQKRTTDAVVMELQNLSEKLTEHARHRARTFIVQGGGHEDMPSVVTVELRMAARIMKLAEREAGHSLELKVRA
jgi:predicted  nucleic acid-binding Zn-ribbon protein